LTSFNLELLKDRIHVIVINNTWERAPWADILYACDFQWWQQYQTAHGFKGLKVTQDEMTLRLFPQVDFIRVRVLGGKDCNRPKLKKFGDLGSGGNGAFHMANLAMHMGATGIALIGVDCTGDHWHGRHQHPCTNPTLDVIDRWRIAFDESAPVFASVGVDVVNCSWKTSTIQAYPKMPIEQMLERWGL
jgi:hypothetical protein